MILRFLACVVALLAVTAAHAQETPFSGLGNAGNGPLDIQADSLEVLQAEQQAIFSGNVVAKQKEMTLRARKMTVHYDSQNASGEAAAAGTPGALKKIVVTGGVTITTPQETAKGDSGVYDARKGELTLEGDVVLTRGQDTISGKKLVYDLETGKSRMVGGSGKEGRVRALFIPQQKTTEAPAAETP